MPLDQKKILKEEKLSTLDAFYTETENEKYFKTFADIRYDIHSMNVFNFSMSKKGKYSFGYMGIMYEEYGTKRPYVRVYFNPTAYNVDDGINQGFDRVDIVKAVPTNSAFFGGAGAVHRDILKIALEKEKDCKDTILGYCGGSLFTKVTDEEVDIDFVNRCNSNKLYKMYDLAFLVNLFTLEHKELVPDSPNATIRIVERSIPKNSHDQFVKSFLKQLSGKKITYNLNRCYSYQIEDLWEKERKEEISELRKDLSHDLMTSFWLATAGKRGSAMGLQNVNGYESYIINILEQAKIYNVPLDIDFVHEKYKNQGSALMVAARNKYSNILDTLLAHKADIYKLDHDRNNVLIHGIKANDPHILRKLIMHESSLITERKPFIDQQNSAGETPLMIAAKEKGLDKEVIELLLGQHPDLTKEDNEGNTALSHAIINNNSYLVEKLSNQSRPMFSL